MLVKLQLQMHVTGAFPLEESSSASTVNLSYSRVPSYGNPSQMQILMSDRNTRVRQEHGQQGID